MIRRLEIIEEAVKVIAGGMRALVTTLTKQMAEDLSEFLSILSESSKDGANTLTLS